MKLLNRNSYGSCFKISESLCEVVNYITQRVPLSNVIYIGNIDDNIINKGPLKTSLYFIGDRKLFKDESPDYLNLLPLNLSKGLPKIDDQILKESIVILDSVIETTTNTRKLLKDLLEWQDIVPCILISDADEKTNKLGKGWSLEELRDFLSINGFHDGFYGYFPRQLYEDNHDILYIGGNLSNYSSVSNSLKVCAIISTYNEEDIIEQVCKYLLDQGINVHIVDNWSTDSTLDIIESLMGKYTNISYEVFPDREERQYVWFEILNRKVQYAQANNYDWYIHYDADEIRESCWGGSLIEGIERVDKLGYNAIDHTVIDFRPVKNGFKRTKNPESYFKYFEFGRRPGHFAQVKAWKNIPGVEYDLSSSGGHEVNFEGIHIFPYKFLLKHYPLRSLEHMKRKIFMDRLPRFELEKKVHGWHSHYDQYMGKEEELKLWKKSELIKFEENFCENYLLERLFGINIKKEL